MKESEIKKEITKLNRRIGQLVAYNVGGKNARKIEKALADKDFYNSLSITIDFLR